MGVAPLHGKAGDPFTVTAADLPPNQEFQMIWRTAIGRWNVTESEYKGREFVPVNYEMARSLLHLDRPREAVGILQSALRGALDASNLYVSRTELHERLAESFERAGERDSAAVHFRAVVRAWSR